MLFDQARTQYYEASGTKSRCCFYINPINIFERDYMYLAYEVTDRMAADIYTKAFSDSRKWKHACVQIGLLEPEMLTDPETLKMVTSSFDPKKETVQAATGSIDGIPTFPYTKVPIMPPNLWWQGLSSKEGLHEHEGHDPVIVAKVSSCGTSHNPRCNVLLVVFHLVSVRRIMGESWGSC